MRLDHLMHFAFRTLAALGVLLQKNVRLLLLKWCINAPAGSETRDHSQVTSPTPYNHYTTFTTQPHFFATFDGTE